MPKVTLSCAVWDKFEIEGPSLCVDDSDLVHLRQQILAIHAVMPFSKIIVKAQTYPATIEFFFKDNRLWKQEHNDNQLDSPVLFALTGTFKPSETVNMRALRELVSMLLFRGLEKADIRPF